MAKADVGILGIAPTFAELYFEGLKQKAGSLKLLKRSLPRGGQRLSRLKGRGMDYAESRPYVPLDEVRRIDWRVSARLNKWHTKLFVEEKDRPIVLVVDFRSSMFFGSKNCFKSYLGAVIAAKLAFLAWRGGDRVGAYIFDDERAQTLVPKNNRVQVAQILRDLEVFGQPKDQSVPAMPKPFLANLTTLAKPGTAIFIISDFFYFDDNEVQALFNIQKRSEVIFLRITDPLEVSLPDIGAAGLTFGNETVFFNTHEKKFRQEYAQVCRTRLDQLNAKLAELNIRCVDFSTAEAPEIGMHRLLRVNA